MKSSQKLSRNFSAHSRLLSGHVSKKPEFLQVSVQPGPEHPLKLIKISKKSLFVPYNAILA